MNFLLNLVIDILATPFLRGDLINFLPINARQAARENLRMRTVPAGRLSNGAVIYKTLNAREWRAYSK